MKKERSLQNDMHLASGSYRYGRAMAWTATGAAAVLGALLLTLGIWSATWSSDDSGVHSSAAMYSLFDTGAFLETEISRAVGPAMERTRILASSPDIVQSLLKGDSTAQTAVLNAGITKCTEIDAVALFTADGRITAINTVYADGRAIPNHRIVRVLTADFSQRQIVQSCARNGANTPVLEFQTQCDITPALFDSTGLSVAYSVPVLNPTNGSKLGVLSSRLRFERLTGLVEKRALAGGAAKAYFVSDTGTYFSEAINRGHEQPPIPTDDLKGIVRPMLGNVESKTVTQRGNSYLAIFSLPEMRTLEGGGIHVLVVADRQWLIRVPRQDRLIQAATEALVGMLLLIVAGLAYSRMIAFQTRRNMIAANLVNARLAAIVHSSAEAIIGEALDGTICSWNPGAEKIFGYSVDEVIGAPAEAIEPSEHKGEMATLRRDLIAGKTIDQYETRRCRKDGVSIDISLSLSLIKSPSGELIGISRIARDITRQKRAERELQEAQDKLERRVQERTRELSEAMDALRHAKESAEVANHAKGVVFNEALDAIVTINAAGLIVAWNHQAETMFRWDRTEVTDRSLAGTIFPGSIWEAHQRDIEMFLKGGEGALLDKVVELVATRRDGHQIPVEVAVTPASSGGEYTFTAFIRDISVRKQIDAKLRMAIEAAEAANRAKGEFLANMSHEIRTPLNGVISLSGLLLDTVLDEPQRRFTSLIKSSGESLSRLLNDILDFSKIEARKLEIEAIDFDVHAVVEEVTQIMCIKAAEKRIELASVTMPQVPRYVNGDPERLKQILINLVNNAIKFTESGSISTRVTLEDPQSQGQMVRFSITDTGVGIPADRMHRLFKSFSQVDSSTTRSYGGTGLGLAISRELAELMGGTIGVESEVGVGSTFWFTVKLGKAVPPAEPTVVRPIIPSTFRVMAVHSNVTILDTLKTQIASWGIEAVTTSDADAAIRLMADAAAASSPFDVAILDGETSNLSALKLGSSIKSDPRLASTALVILLPMNATVETTTLRAAGFSGHLIKPIRQSLLYDVIVNVTNPVSRAEPTAGELSNRMIAAKEGLVGGRLAKILVADDNRVNQIVAHEVLAKHGYTCEVVDNGRKAVDAVVLGGYDLVLMDCSMPEMDGFEATRRIREHERADHRPHCPHLPIIALTANAINGDRERCLEMGMDDYVSKPIDPKRLIDAIKACLSRTTPNQTSTTTTPRTTNFSLPGLEVTSQTVLLNPPMAIDALLDRCMGNSEAAFIILDEFETQATADIAALQRYVSSGNASEMARVAHALKGASGILAAEAVARLTHELETMGRSGAIAEADRVLQQLHSEVSRCIEYLPTVRAAIQAGTKSVH